MRDNRKPLQRPVRRLARDERGGIVIMFALLFPVFSGMVALSIDIGSWYADKRALQSAADSGAIAAAFELWDGTGSAVMENAARTEAKRNGYDSTNGTFSIILDYYGDSTGVEVSLSQPGKTFLVNVLLPNLSVTINARAVARLSTVDQACVLTLAETGTAITIAGGGVQLEGCGLMANSTAEPAITSGRTSLDADCVRAVGGIELGNDTELDCGAAVSGTRAQKDPFADVMAPTMPGGACQDANTDISNGRLKPNVRYCKGMKHTNAGGDVVLDPGTYYFDGGDISITGGSFTGSNVTIILGTSTGEDAASISVTGQGDVELTAPSSGTYAGILFYQDGNPQSNKKVQFVGQSHMSLSGVLYFPNSTVEFSGGSSLSAPDCTQIVSNRLSFTGVAHLKADCESLGLDDGMAILGVRIVE